MDCKRVCCSYGHVRGGGVILVLDLFLMNHLANGDEYFGDG